jgi:hypothetical protein
MRYPGGLIAPTPVNQQYPSGVWTGPQVAPYQANNVWGNDTSFRNTTLLLHGDGANAAQNNTFIDSANNYTITRAGTITQGSFTPYNPGYYSNYFDGTGDYLSVASNAANALGSGDFTIQMWFFLTGTTGVGASGEIGLVGCGNTTSSRYVIRCQGSSTRIMSWWLNTPSNNVTGTTPIALNTWYHVALVRSGSGSNNVKMYLNGTLECQGTSTYNSPADTISIGRGYPNLDGEYTNGYISNLQMVVGTAVYTANFTPSTTPLTAITNTSLLTCQSNRFLDNSTNNFTVTKNGDTSVQAFQPFPPALQYTTASFSGSGYFYGASNSLTTPSGTCPVINNFSASGWVYRTSVPGYQQTFVALGIDGSGRVGFFWTGNNFEYNIYGSSTVSIDGSGAMPVGVWTYVVLTRTSSTLSLYYNGTLIASVSLGTAFSASSGRSMLWMDGTIGYATNLRFDTAAYSTPTVVPTAPVSTTANTNNLLNFTNAGIFDNAMQNNLVTEGDTKISTSVVKYGTGSIAFDGTGDYLTAYRNFSIAASENFTVEGWFYLTAAQANYRMIVSDGTKYFTVNSTGMEIQFGGVSGTVASATYTFAQNVWYHIAVVRNNNVVAIYVNGIALTMSQASQSAAFLDTSTLLYVSRYTSGTDYPWFGYMDDLRITKGVARYVGNFTPPVARMPNQ